MTLKEQIIIATSIWRNLKKKVHLCPLLPPLMGEFQQENLVFDTQNAAEQLDFNLNEKRAQCALFSA